MKRILLLLCLSIFLSSFSVNRLPADDGDSFASFIRKNYTKKEVYIPMRDGLRLFTSIYIPKDRSVRYPILLNRTPYSVAPYGRAKKTYIGPSEKLARDLYIIVYQDVRGKFMSEGTFDDMRPQLTGPPDSTAVDESTDTWDTVDWLVRNVPNNNGRVGIWGISYPGFYAAVASIHAHPALKAISPQAPIADWFFDDFHHHGAFFLPHAFNFISVFGQERKGLTKTWPPRFDHGTDDGFDFFLNRVGALSNVDPRFFQGRIAFWDSLVAHPNYDAYWQKRNLLPHLRGIRPAILVVGGWFDAEDLYGSLNIYQAIEKNNPGADNRLVMGPWAHGGWARGTGSSLGDVFFGDQPAPSVFFQEEVEYPFFSHYLKDRPLPSPPEALVFETGTNRWREFDHWPPENTIPRCWYLKANGTLSTDSLPDTNPSRVFTSDPWNPVPYTQLRTVNMNPLYMTEDQSFVSKRRDVLVYVSPPLSAPLSLAGPVRVNLQVSTSQGDADWIVKLIDVYPEDAPPPPHRKYVKAGGMQQMVRSEVFRGRFRNSYSVPEAFVPDRISPVAFPLQDVFHTFLPGHRIMIQVQSTWFPLVDRNPQKYVGNIFKAVDRDFEKAEHRVYDQPGHRSFIEAGVLPEEKAGSSEQNREPVVPVLDESKLQ